jgi:phenylacetic acid degradation operon negative regulatory protein
MTRLVDRTLKATAPRSKSLIVSLLGDSIKPRGGTFWLGSLICACAPLDINERAVRTSVQRLSRDGWLQSERVGRKSRYFLTREGLARIDQASPRMYSPPIEIWDGHWTVAFAAPGSLQAWERSQLRKYLEWEGYTMVSSGMFLHPLGKLESVNEILEELDLSTKVYVFRASTLDGANALALCEGVGRFWDLESASQRYESFLALFGPILEALDRCNGPESDAEAFHLRLLTIHAFRRASLHAPRLPAVLFSEGWPGLDAYELCRSIYQHCWHGSESHLDKLYSDQGENPGQPDGASLARFGGVTPGATVQPAAHSAGRAG